MDKTQKELVKTYYHARNNVALNHTGYYTYEITELAIKKGWIDQNSLDDVDVSYAIIKNPELVHPLGLREIDPKEYITGYAWLAVIANSNNWWDLGDVDMEIRDHRILIDRFFINDFNMDAPYKEKGLNFLISKLTDYYLFLAIESRPELLNNPVILKNAIGREYSEIFMVVTTYKPELLSHYGKTFEDLDGDHLADIIYKGNGDKEELIPIIKKKIKEKYNYSDEKIEHIIQYNFYNEIN